MTRHEARDHLPVIQALADGKTIQWLSFKGGPWLDTNSPEFDSAPDYYRVKPEPREFWAAVWSSKEEAEKFLDYPSGCEIVKVREVL